MNNWTGCADGCRTRRIHPPSVRDDICGNCGDDANLEVDHAIPRSRGGCECRDNLWTLCRTCNRLKNWLTVQEFYESGLAGWLANRKAEEWAWNEELKANPAMRDFYENVWLTDVP
jgi:hypothetical protein